MSGCERAGLGSGLEWQVRENRGRERRREGERERERERERGREREGLIECVRESGFGIWAGVAVEREEREGQKEGEGE